jgi:hypothetical protein
LNFRISQKTSSLWSHFRAVLKPCQKFCMCPKFFANWAQVFTQNFRLIIILLKFVPEYENYNLTWSMASAWAATSHSYFSWQRWVSYIMDSLSADFTLITWNLKKLLVLFALVACKDCLQSQDFSLFSWLF